jgi:hypothetical protein
MENVDEDKSSPLVPNKRTDRNGGNSSIIKIHETTRINANLSESDSGQSDINVEEDAYKKLEKRGISSSKSSPNIIPN